MRTVTQLTLGGVLLVSAVAAEARSSPYDLDDVAYIEDFVGSRAAKELLGQQGFVVTDRQFKQIFEAYIGQAVPKFITTDSAWHTYHVLLEEGVRVLEEGQAARLKEFSAGLLQAALARSGDTEGPYLDLARFAGVGLALQDEDSVSSMDTRIRKQVQETLDALGGPQPFQALFFGLPVTPDRFQAASFYTSSKDLQGYFAARQWYGLTVFRARSEAETERAVLLALMVKADQRLSDLYAALTLPYDALLGRCEDADVAMYQSMAESVFGKVPPESEVKEKLALFVQHALSKLPDPMVNDQLLLPEQYARFAEETKGFRLLPPRRLPSAVLFQNTVDPAIKGRMSPSGVDFFTAGPLASEAGKRALRATVKDEAVAEAILAAKAGVLPESLHGQALSLLKLLQDPLPESAPQPLRTSAWQDKQLWTQLGAWAEQRHTWALHTKLTVHYLGLTREDPGMVSPYPQFFSGLGQLARATAQVLSRHTGSVKIDVQAVGKELVETVDVMRNALERREQPTPELMEKIQALEGFLEAFFASKPAHSQTDFARGLQELADIGQRAAQSKELTPEEMSVLKSFRNPTDVVTLLTDFADLCDALAAIATKELAGTPLTETDTKVISSYGKSLARFHFYGGNSWLTPRDDFPLVTSVFVSPIQGQVLYAGVGRPEALYVIVEKEGKPVLHFGAVLSYREFQRPVSAPLDDQAWQAEVRSGPIPEPPAFTSSFRSAISEDDVVQIIRSGGIYEAADSVAGSKVTHALVEVLLEGSSPNASVLREQLCSRAREEDVGDLLRVLQKTDPGEIEELAFCVARLPWQKHCAELLELLHHPVNEYADAAAYILSRRPEAIEVKALVSGFGEQAPRTKRLYCFLLGYVANRDAEATRLLVEALADGGPGVRYQAACAIAQGQVRGANAVEALTRLVEDTNPYVAQAAAFALRTLGAKDAAPAMLARLQRGMHGREFNDYATDAQAEAVFGGTRYTGSPVLMVLSWPPGQEVAGGRGARVSFGASPTPPSVELGQELIKGLSAFRYAPAQATLEAMLGGDLGVEALSALKDIDPAGHRQRAVRMLDGPHVIEAIEALQKVDPEGHLQRLLTAALAPDAPRYQKQWALEQIDAQGKPEDALRLLSLLEDTSEMGFSVNSEEWRLCDFAAQAIATLLGWEENISWQKGSDRNAKEALIGRIKAWAKTQTPGRP